VSGDFSRWLDQLGLGRYAETFRANDVDFESVVHLTDGDLEALGLSLGHRRILLAAAADLDTPNATRRSRQAGPSYQAEQDAERRQLSVMFCDIVGSTALSRELDPEDLRELFRRFQNAVVSGVSRYDGYVAKFLGDGILAYFGWPQAYEDHA